MEGRGDCKILLHPKCFDSPLTATAGDSPAAARVTGDNLAAVRYGAGHARYRRLPLQAQMEEGLRPLALAGWRLTWQAVRRRYNQAADFLAGVGQRWAVALGNRGVRTIRTVTIWTGAPPDRPEGFPADDWEDVCGLC